jgi:hypothetical protein
MECGLVFGCVCVDCHGTLQRSNQKRQRQSTIQQLVRNLSFVISYYFSAPAFFSHKNDSLTPSVVLLEPTQLLYDANNTNFLSPRFLRYSFILGECLVPDLVKRQYGWVK